MQSLSGVAGTIARATGEPRFVPMVMSDHTSGLIAAQCIGFALYRREKTGKGEAIDVPMLENMASFVSSEHSAPRPSIRRSARPATAACSAPTTGRCRPRTATSRCGPTPMRRPSPSSTRSAGPSSRPIRASTAPPSRTKNAAAYFEVQATCLGHKTTDEWVELFDKLDVPAARYNTIDDLMTDPHLTDVGFFREEQHPTEGKIRRTKLANVFSGGAREDETHAPLYGEHTREILAEVGYSERIADASTKAGIRRPKRHVLTRALHRAGLLTLTAEPARRAALTRCSTQIRVPCGVHSGMRTKCRGSRSRVRTACRPRSGRAA